MNKCLKQIIQIELNKVKNPNLAGPNQLAIYKRGRGFELGTTESKSSSVEVRAGLELGTSELQVLRSNHSATLPPICMYIIVIIIIIIIITTTTTIVINNSFS